MSDERGFIEMVRRINFEIITNYFKHGGPPPLTYDSKQDNESEEMYASRLQKEWCDAYEYLQTIYTDAGFLRFCLPVKKGAIRKKK
jgi:hypothetical protein